MCRVRYLTDRLTFRRGPSMSRVRAGSRSGRIGYCTRRRNDTGYNCDDNGGYDDSQTNHGTEVLKRRPSGGLAKQWQQETATVKNLVVEVVQRLRDRRNHRHLNVIRGQHSRRHRVADNHRQRTSAAAHVIRRSWRNRRASGANSVTSLRSRTIGLSGRTNRLATRRQPRCSMNREAADRDNGLPRACSAPDAGATLVDNGTAVTRSEARDRIASHVEPHSCVRSIHC